MKEEPFRLKMVDAREYKVMLQTQRFRGGPGQRKSAVRECWNRLSDLASSNGTEVSGDPLEDEDKRRVIRFYDTADHALYRKAGYILRLRRKIGSAGKWEETLKFRHSDWVRSAGLAFEASSDGDSKFEEDIKAQASPSGFLFVPLFSRSAERKTDKEPRSIEDLISNHTGLDEEHFPSPATPLSLVRDFEAREEVFEDIKWKLADGVGAKCAIVLWSDGDGETVAVEFSSRYVIGNEPRSSRIAAQTWGVFSSICASEWADPTGVTKTSLVYDGPKAGSGGARFG